MVEHDVEHDLHNICEKMTSYTAFDEADGEIGEKVYDTNC